MKKEIQSVLFFLVLQNVLYVFLIFCQYSTPLSQAIGSIFIGGAVYIWLEHEDRIKEHLKGTVEFIPVGEKL